MGKIRENATETDIGFNKYVYHINVREILNVQEKTGLTH